MRRLGMQGRGLLVSLAILGCTDSKNHGDVTTVRSALTTTFSIPVVANENPMEVTLAASSFLNMNDRSKVAESRDALTVQSVSHFKGRVSNLGVGIAANQAGTGLGVSARCGTIVSKPLVQLRSNSTVTGSVYQESTLAIGMQTGVTVTGVMKTGIVNRVPGSGDARMQITADTTWNKIVTWPTTINQSPTTLDPNGSPAVVTLAPGAYTTVDVKSNRGIKLTTGEYFFDGLIIETGGQLAVDASAGPVYAYILDGGFIFRGAQFGGASTPGLPVPSFTVMTTGSATLERAFLGVVIAPNGNINLQGAAPSLNNSSHWGAAFGKSITLFEDNQILHYRDPYSFRGFVPNDGASPPFIGDRVAVTGGNIMHPVGFGITDEAHQNETVAAVSRDVNAYTVMVGYNDLTVNEPPSPAAIQYSGATSNNDARDGQNRTLAKGTSIMGWSYSLDGGQTFAYGGRVPPQPGWSIIWSDPAVAKTDIDDPNVYYAMISGSTAAFDDLTQNTGGVIVNDPTNTNPGGALDGYCIAKSTDRGRTFPVSGCIAPGFQDGTALAAIKDVNFHRQVYVSGSKTHVYWMDGETAQFHDANAIPDPFPVGTHIQHPRMRAFGGLIYILVRHSNGHDIIANRLNIANNQWLGMSTLATDAGGGGSLVFGSPGSVESGPILAFDFGPGVDGFTKLRLLYGSFKTGTQRQGLRVRECDIEPTLGNCQTLPGSTFADPGEEADPSLRFSGGVWMGAWRKVDGPLPTVMRHVVGRITNTGIDERTVRPGIAPCVFGGVDGRWGEYDYLDGYGDGRFFAPYGVNGPGCRWQGRFTSDSHIGGSVFKF